MRAALCALPSGANLDTDIFDEHLSNSLLIDLKWDVERRTMPHSHTVCVYFVMALSAAVTNPITEDIDVLVFLPQNNSYLFSHARVAPAILYAQRTLRTDGGRFSGFHFNVHFEKSDCVNDAIFVLVDKSCGQKPDLILGPVCEYEAAAVVRLASHWDVPVISAGALAAGFGNKKSEYSHLTRIAPSYGKMAETFIAMFEHFTWKSALLLYEDDKEERNCYFTLEGVYHQMIDYNIKTYAFSQEDRLDTEDVLHNIQDTEGKEPTSPQTTCHVRPRSYDDLGKLICFHSSV